MANEEIEKITDISHFIEIIKKIKWIPVTRRIEGDKLEWFLWRLRKERIAHGRLGQGIHGQVIQVDESRVLDALRILNEPIDNPSISVEAGVAWDDLPNDDPIFKGQADDILPPGTKLTGQFFDFETGKPLEGFSSSEE